MSPEVIEKKPEFKLDDVEQMEMDEEVRTREQYNSIHRTKYADNRNRYERWFSRRLGFRLHITKSKRVATDVPGESEIRPGLSIKFMGGELILDKADPFYALMTKKLRNHHYFALKHLVCVDDLDAEEKKRTTQKTIGVSQRHQLRAIGVMSPKQQDEIVRVLGVKSSKEFDALAKEAKSLKEENKKLKEGKSEKTLAELQAENTVLTAQQKQIADLRAENERPKAEATNDGTESGPTAGPAAGSGQGSEPGPRAGSGPQAQRSQGSRGSDGKGPAGGIRNGRPV